MPWTHLRKEYTRRKGVIFSMGKLADWAKENSQFLKIQDGESVEVVFKKSEFILSVFDKDKQTVRYTFETGYGEKNWDTSAGYVALFFDEVKAGQKVKITREGEGTKTKYKLSKLDK